MLSHGQYKENERELREGQSIHIETDEMGNWSELVYVNGC